jgi:signal transduction histidine kinase
MKGNQTYRFWRSATRCLLGSIGVALPAFVCFRLHTRPVLAALLYLIIVVLLPVSDGFVPSVFVSIIAVLCLNHFFLPPLFTLQVGGPLDVVALIVFLGTALLIIHLMSQRKRAEEALSRANDELRAEIGERQRAEEALQKAQAELAHVSRLMTLGELTASISHEVNQPLAAVVTNGQVCLRLLALEMPRPDEMRAVVACCALRSSSARSGHAVPARLRTGTADGCSLSVRRGARNLRDDVPKQEDWRPVS